MKKSIKNKLNKQLSFFIDAKLQSKLKKIKKEMKYKSMSETVRKCIEVY